MENGAIWFTAERIYEQDAAFITEACNSYELVKAQRDELLAVCKLVIKSQTWDGNDPDEDRWGDFYAQARAAIAKAEGGAQ